MDDGIKSNILLVDDRPENLLALEAILEPLGQNLVSVNSGQDALKQLLHSDFAVILLDVQMPVMDGFETAALIKQRERTQHIPIIFLTAISKDEAYVFKGYTAGAVDYISKPFDPNILRSKVGVFVELFQKTEQVKMQAELLRLAAEREREREVAELKRLSERRYRNLAESMPQIVWTATAGGTPTYFNQRWVDYTGLSESEETGWPDRYSVVHPDDAAALADAWSAAVKYGEDYEGEYRLRRARDGAYRWHLERAVALRDESGNVASWIGTSTDIDDQKRAEDALRFLAEASSSFSSSLDYSATLASVADLAVPHLADWCVVDILEEDGTIRRLAMSHADPSKVELSRDMEQRYPGDKNVLLGAPTVLRTGRSELVPEIPDEMFTRAAGDEEHLEALRALGLVSYMCVPMVARGRILGSVTFVSAESGRRYEAADLALAEDLGRRAALAVDNAQLYAIAQAESEKLQQANRAKDEFLATLSHELRTPLNSMLGWTQLLRTGKLDEATFARALETIERNTKTQAQLIADLLDVSRIITGKLHLNIRPVNIAGVIEAAVDAVRPAATAKNIELMIIVDPSVGAVTGDSDRLQQIVWNLLSNALKFTPEEGRVEVRLDRKRTRAVFSVTDTGQGISREFLPYVFDRFRQADSTSTREYGGLGLGLAIVRHLAELHGGHVSVTSPGEGHGATFTVELPIAAPSESSDDERAEDSSGEIDCPPELRGLRVLVVEDEDDGRDLLGAVLSECGAIVTAVASAAEALAAFGVSPPDVLLSDIGLPGEDGYALIRKVRALRPEQGGRVPAVALTAYASAEDRARALSAGFQVHVAKPVEPSELTAVLAELTVREKK